MNKNEAMVELCELNMRVFDYYHKYHKNVRTLTSIQINILIKAAHVLQHKMNKLINKHRITIIKAPMFRDGDFYIPRGYYFWPLEWESTLPKRLIYQP